jgi:hypothetical protein
MREVEVYDPRELLNINTASGNICRHQDLHPTLFEVVESFCSLRL